MHNATSLTFLCDVFILNAKSIGTIGPEGQEKYQTESKSGQLFTPVTQAQDTCCGDYNTSGKISNPFSFKIFL